MFRRPRVPVPSVARPVATVRTGAPADGCAAITADGCARAVAFHRGNRAPPLPRPVSRRQFGRVRHYHRRRVRIDSRTGHAADGDKQPPILCAYFLTENRKPPKTRGAILAPWRLVVFSRPETPENGDRFGTPPTVTGATVRGQVTGNRPASDSPPTVRRLLRVSRQGFGQVTPPTGSPRPIRKRRRQVRTDSRTGHGQHADGQGCATIAANGAATARPCVSRFGTGAGKGAPSRVPVPPVARPVATVRNGDRFAPTGAPVPWRFTVATAPRPIRKRRRQVRIDSRRQVTGNRRRVWNGDGFADRSRGNRADGCACAVAIPSATVRRLCRVRFADRCGQVTGQPPRVRFGNAATVRNGHARRRVRLCRPDSIGNRAPLAMAFNPP